MGGGGADEWLLVAIASRDLCRREEEYSEIFGCEKHTKDASGAPSPPPPPPPNAARLLAPPPAAAAAPPCLICMRFFNLSASSDTLAPFGK